jgi:hypothetical protein
MSSRQVGDLNPSGQVPPQETQPAELHSVHLSIYFNWSNLNLDTICPFCFFTYKSL